MKHLHDMECYLPQLTEDIADWGTGYVDQILPVHHVEARWEPLHTLISEVQAAFAR